MTAKRCLDCKHLGRENLPRTGRLCYGIPTAHELIRPVIAKAALETFYCSQFEAAIVRGIHIQDGEIQTPRQNCGKQRVVEIAPPSTGS